MAAATETPKFSPEMVASLFDEFDADGDGKLDVTEFQIMCSGLGFAFPEAKAATVSVAGKSLRVGSLQMDCAAISRAGTSPGPWHTRRPLMREHLYVLLLNLHSWQSSLISVWWLWRLADHGVTRL